MAEEEEARGVDESGGERDDAGDEEGGSGMTKVCGLLTKSDECLRGSKYC